MNDPLNVPVKPNFCSDWTSYYAPMLWLWTMSLNPFLWLELTPVTHLPNQNTFFTPQTNSILLPHLPAWRAVSLLSITRCCHHLALKNPSYSTFSLYWNPTHLSRTIVLEPHQNCKPHTRHSSTSHKTEIWLFFSAEQRPPPAKPVTSALSLWSIFCQWRLKNPCLQPSGPAC